MTRIQTTLSKLKAQNKTALIPYVMAGFPYADVTPELMHGMVSAGADVIELGVPPAPLRTTGAPAEPTFTARAVATPVPKPLMPVEIGRPVPLVSVTD